MEGLASLVSQSLARYGFETSLDHRRLQWSPWCRCQDSLSFLLAPGKPGIFALAEEVAVFREASEPRGRHTERSEGSPGTGGKRTLALFRIAEADDLGLALGRLFLPGSPERERFAASHCFARYALMEDAGQRRAALAALQQWMVSSAETASGLSGPASSRAVPLAESSNKEAQIGPPSPLPLAF